MKCPDCNAPLESRSFRYLDLDVCSRCQGIWFDREEVESYRKAVGSSKPLHARFHDRFRPSGSGDMLECPRCEEKTLRRGRLKDFEVARCEECFGVFATADAMAEDLGRDNIPRSTSGEAPSLAEVAVGLPFELLLLLLD